MFELLLNFVPFEASRDVLEETIKLLEERNLGCAQEPQRMWALKGMLYFTRDLIDPHTSYEHFKSFSRKYWSTIFLTLIRTFLKTA